MTNRRGSNDSPVTIVSQETADDAASKFIFILWVFFLLYQRMYQYWEYVYMSNITFDLFLSPLLAASSSYQRNPIEGHRYHRSRHPNDATMTNEESSLSGTPRASAHSRPRPVPTSYSFWLNTGDNNNQLNANFMRLTYAASCRARLSRSVERCPRACRGILSRFPCLVITHVCAWASTY